MLVCLKYDLNSKSTLHDIKMAGGGTYDKTFENSLEGDMTKLSFVLDQEIRCWILWSSSMLCPC